MKLYACTNEYLEITKYVISDNTGRIFGFEVSEYPFNNTFATMVKDLSNINKIKTRRLIGNVHALIMQGYDHTLLQDGFETLEELKQLRPELFI
jgi:hypothetical protein